MESALLIARIILAAVFLVAGLAKLADLTGSKLALHDFGVPTKLAAPLGLLLPLAELVVAITLLPSTWAWWGAVGALVLLLLFVAGISINLARGRTPDCHCFGQLHSASAGPSTLIRNLVLAALSGVIVGFGHTTASFDLGSWLGVLAIPQRIEVIGGVVVLAALVGEGWLLWQMVRQQGRLLLRLEAFETRVAEARRAPLTGGETEGGLAVGTPAPDFRLPDREGNTVTLESLLRLGNPVLLLFADPGCGPCAALLPDIGRWQRDYENLLTVAVVSRGTVESNQGEARTYGISQVLLQQDREVQTSYQASATPSALLIRPDGTIGSRLAQGTDATRSLLAVAIGLSMHRLKPLPVSPDERNGETPTMKPRQFAAQSINESAQQDIRPANSTRTTFTAADQTRVKAEEQPIEAEREIELTIGMATYNDFDGVYFTVQALRLYQDLSQTELLVIDNYGCEATQKLVETLPNARYIRAINVVGTAAPRELVFREARGHAVLCCDCHVLFAPGVIARLKQFYREHPACDDLLQGPMLYDDGNIRGTHMDPYWGVQIWGTWGRDPRGNDPEGEPFEIPMQGLGAFSCRKSAWLGFHPDFRGFGGEEGYIHEKFRQAGRCCLCLPWFRWLHRFPRPAGVPYPCTLEDKIRNYVIGQSELGLSFVPVLQHFSEFLPQDRVITLAERVRSGK